jgi:cell division protein FtsB
MPRAGSAMVSSVQQMSVDLIGSRVEVRRRGGIIPSWVTFSMIILAISAVCFTVNMRTHAKATVAAEQLSVIESDVQTLRSVNEALRVEVQRLRTDPRTIENEARARLNMVRANEFVVPVE